MFTVPFVWNLRPSRWNSMHKKNLLKPWKIRRKWHLFILPRLRISRWKQRYLMHQSFMPFRLLPFTKRHMFPLPIFPHPRPFKRHPLPPARWTRTTLDQQRPSVLNPTNIYHSIRYRFRHYRVLPPLNHWLQRELLIYWHIIPRLWNLYHF